MALETLDRREFVVGSVAAGATLLLPGGLSAAEDGKKTFTILHTNDLHSNLIGMGPASDTPRSPSTTTQPRAGMRVWPP
jgi:5'-nucleotidase/UDP-sugar diphosphatase